MKEILPVAPDAHLHLMMSEFCIWAVLTGVQWCLMVEIRNSFTTWDVEHLSLRVCHLLLLFGEGNGIPLQSSCLENPMDGGAWCAAVHGVAKSRTQLSNFTFTFHFHALEKEMATHPSVLAWRIPGMGEPGGLLSMGLHRVGHD